MFRKLFLNSSSCSDFTSKDNYLSSRYFPRWRWTVVRDYINSSSGNIEEVGRQLQDTAVFPDKKGYFHLNIARLKDFEISAELKYDFNPHNNSVLNITKQWLQDFASWSKSHFRNGSESFRWNHLVWDYLWQGQSTQLRNKIISSVDVSVS